MVHGAVVAVDDRGGFGQQLAEIVAVEHEMRAAEHDRIHGGQVVLVEIAVQRAHDEVMVAELAVLHDLNEFWARLRPDGVV